MAKINIIGWSLLPKHHRESIRREREKIDRVCIQKDKESSHARLYFYTYSVLAFQLMQSYFVIKPSVLKLYSFQIVNAQACPHEGHDVETSVELNT